MALTGTVGAEPAKCKAGIVKASASYVQARAKLLQKCEDTIVKGKLPQSTVCTTEAKTTEKLAKAVAKLATAVSKACGGKDKLCGGDLTGEDGGTAIGFPATCPNFESGACTNPIGSTDCSGIATCLLCIDNASVDQAIGLSYTNLVTTDPKAAKVLNKCQAAIGKSALGFLAAKSKALSKCWDAVNKGKGNSPCPVPGDGKAAAAIGKAVVKLSDGIKKACAGKDKILGGTDVNADFTPAEIGFPATCNDVDPPGAEGPCGGQVTDLQGIITCLTCVNEFKVDCADGVAASTLATYPFQCNPGPTPTPTPTPTASSTPSTTPTPGICGDNQIQAGEFCDGTATGGACGAGFTCTACNCACPSKVHFAGDNSSEQSILDTGWTGIAHRAPIISNGDVTVALNCSPTERPCGTCTVTGPIANPNAGNGQLDNHRCSNDPSIRCSDNTPCTAGGGTCVFYFGSNLPLAAGGVSTCVVNVFSQPVTGTANVETGEAATTAKLSSRVFFGNDNDAPCPRCIGDAQLNDGALGGTCNDGPRLGLPCDGNGSVFNRPDFGVTSLDCPGNPGSLVANLPIDLTNSTGTVTKTLTNASPNCGGDPTQKCMCDTCNNLGTEPCDDNSDCPDPVGPIGPICGGKRCAGGTNAGAACTGARQCVGGSNSGGSCPATGGASACPSGTCTPFCTVICSGGSNDGSACIDDSECPGGDCPQLTCGRFGEPTLPSGCLNDTNTPGVLDCEDGDGDGEGECTVGPLFQNCTVASGHAQRSCEMDVDCGGGSGTCQGSNRRCFLTGGLVGDRQGTDTLVAQGMADPPVGDVANPTLGAVFCIGPVAQGAVNGAAGLPGPGRVTIFGQAEGLP